MILTVCASCIKCELISWRLGGVCVWGGGVRVYLSVLLGTGSFGVTALSVEGEMPSYP